MRRVLASIVVLVVLLAAFPLIVEAQGLNAGLKGDYAFTFYRTCVSGLAVVFGTNSVPVVELPASTSAGAAHGTVTYNGDGTGSYTHRVLDVNQPPVFGQIPVVQGEQTCDLTYSVNPDGSFAQALSNCSGPMTIGFFTGHTFAISGIQTQGRIAPGGQTLLWFDTDSSVETITSLSLSSSQFPPRHRICNRSGTAVKIVP